MSDRTELTTQLRTLLASFREWNTRLTKAAYRKGVDAGLAGGDPTNPYAQRGGNNHLRGGNDPRNAWGEGLRDGSRISELLTEPGKVFPPITWREAKLVGYEK